MSQSDVLEVFTRWDESIVSNNASEISKFMTDDWVIVGGDGLRSKSDFLALIESGKLTHNRMDSDEQHVKVYGNTAIVISKGTSAGHYSGQAFSLYEWSTSVFLKTEAGWVCAVTMLTNVK